MKKLINEIEKYLPLIFILIISLAISTLPIINILKSLALIPGIGSLITIVYKLWQEERIRQHEIETQNKEQDFVLGTASHMAQVAYDKHVSFCEEYIERVQAGRQELFADGPSKKAMYIGRDLVVIRQKHSCWLTKEIEDSLIPFEQALIKIGAQEHMLDALEVGDRRNKVIDEIYRAFGLVLGHDKPLNEEEADLAVDKVIEKIRNILGISILTKLRFEVSRLSLERLQQ